MDHVVSAELVANVLSVDVELDQVVKPGDSLVMLESMKMEIPVLSDVPGRVSEVVVHPGDVVHDGDPMIVIRES